MKNIGLVLLTLGVGLCGAFGARNSEGIHNHTTITGAAAMHESAAAAAYEAYCTDGEDEPLPASDMCGNEDAVQDRAFYEIAQSAAHTLEGYIVAGREGWITALQGKVDSAEAAAALGALPAPEIRFKQWAGANGLPVGFGILLVIGGSLLARRGAKEALEGPSESGGPIDFGVVLGEAAAAAEALADEMSAKSQPTPEDFEMVKLAITKIKDDQFERLIEARFAVQTRHGLEIYAQIFGPLSGAERFLNRAWAAATDGHWPETRASVERAVEQAHTAHKAVPS
jgi:hypothetical protein